SQTIKKFDAEIEELQKVADDPSLPRTESRDIDIANPQIPKLEQEVAGLEAQREELNKQLAIYGAAFKTKHEAVVNAGPNEAEDKLLEATVNNLTRTYQETAEKLEDLDLKIANIPATAHVMEAAVAPISPVGPQRTQQLTLAMLMGAL